MKIRYMIAVSLVFAATSVKAQGIPTIDVSSIAQSIQLVKNTAAQITNQIESLKTLGFETFAEITGPLTDTYMQIRGVMQDVQGIQYQVAAVESQFNTIFPNKGTFTNMDAASYLHYADQWAGQLNAASKNAMKSQAVLENITSNSNAVQGILSRSSNGAGEVRQMQSANQLLSVLSSQISDMTTVMATTGRVAATAVATEQAEKAADQARLAKATDPNNVIINNSARNATY